VSSATIRDLLRFMAGAAETTSRAARVITTVADHIQGAPADAESQRALRDLVAVHSDMEIRAHELESRLTGELLSDDAPTIPALPRRLDALEERVNGIVAGLGHALGEFVINTAKITALDGRLTHMERLLGAAASAGTFRQLDDPPPPTDVFGREQ
jgi:hypothetical protein